MFGWNHLLVAIATQALFNCEKRGERALEGGRQREWVGIYVLYRPLIGDMRMLAICYAIIVSYYTTYMKEEVVRYVDVYPAHPTLLKRRPQHLPFQKHLLVHGYTDEIYRHLHQG